MMAFGHAISGWCTAMMFINFLSLLTDIPVIAAFVLALGCGLAMAGAAILPDIDHQHSTITGAFGPVSYLAHKGSLELHYMACSLTNDAGNRQAPSAHRGVTHWWPFPIVSGIIVTIGCLWSKWFFFACLIVLFTGAIRALTIPDYSAQSSHTLRHQWSMLAAHGIINNIAMWLPFGLTTTLIVGWLSSWNLKVIAFYVTALAVLFGALYIIKHLKQAHKYLRRTKRIGGHWTFVRIPVGKIITIVIASNLAIIAIQHDYVIDHKAWLGLLVCIGMYVHILGDAPTEMGIPGFKLTQFWRLPKWVAFKAGGPFEIICCWLPMTALGVYCIPGLRPHDEVVMVQQYVLISLGIVIALAIAIEFGSRYMKKRAWVA